jgi:hypothetical protein
MAALIGLILALAVAGSAHAYTSGVPTGLTGAPGENTCADCHDNLNNGGGGISISAPYSCAPGETLEISVDMHHMGQHKWGFELTCLDGLDEPCGEFLIHDPDRTQLDMDGDNGRQYVMHTGLGTDEGHMNMCLGWTFEWVAPMDDHPQITFYAAGVAANDGQGTNGDYVYTEALAIEQTPVDASSWGRIKQLYR